MQSVQQRHPTPQQLADFSAGKLSENESSAVEEHLAQCSDCCELLTQLPDDTLVSLLKPETDTSVSSELPRADVEATIPPEPIEATLPPGQDATRMGDKRSPADPVIPVPLRQGAA